jgi:hypothetical protein
MTVCFTVDVIKLNFNCGLTTAMGSDRVKGRDGETCTGMQMTCIRSLTPHSGFESRQWYGLIVQALCSCPVYSNVAKLSERRQSAVVRSVKFPYNFILNYRRNFQLD